MPRKRFAAEQIISKLREAQVLLRQGKAAAWVWRALNVSEQIYRRRVAERHLQLRIELRDALIGQDPMQPVF